MDENQLLDELYEKRKFSDEQLNIAVVGKVSAGKSSLINAIFGCKPGDETIAPVGATSGVTTKVTPYTFDERTLVIDCPGLDDVRAENSEETKRFLSQIDIGLFVVTGSADESQKSSFNDLKNHCKHVIVVLNKIDEWKDSEDSVLEEVITQWKSCLEVGTIFRTCTKGYDPQMRKDVIVVLQGIEELKNEILQLLEKQGKALFLARHLKNKQGYARKIIVTALLAVAGEAFIPGSAAYITATQVVAITSLNYLYTGETLNKSSALSLIPVFAGESIGTSIFLLAKSFLPPTGAVDLAAAVVAVTITFAMLAAVKWVLENEHDLSDKEELKKAFQAFKEIAKEFKNLSLADLKSSEAIMNLVTKLFSKSVHL